jgi:hypothetical protein
MFKKELVDVLKQTGWFIAASLALAAALLAFRVVPRQPYTAVIVPVLQIGLLFWGLFLGASTFGRERRQRAVEYALSLPYSRRALLIRLAGARLLVLAGLWVLSTVAQSLWTKSASAVDSWGTAMGVALYSLALFTIALSLSPVIENFIALCLITVFVGLLTFPLRNLIIFAFDWIKGSKLLASSRYFFEGSLFAPLWTSLWLWFFPILIAILPFAAALYLSFPKFDVRPSAGFKKRYGKVLAVALSACFAAGLITAAITYPDFIFTRFITPDHKLVEFELSGIQIRSSAGTTKIRTTVGYGWPKYAGGGRIINTDGERLFLLDTASGQNRPLYDSREGRPQIGPFWPCGEQVLFFDEQRSKTRQLSLNIVDMDTSDVRNYRPIRLSADWMPRLILIKLFGTGRRDGRRFWLFIANQPKTPPLRIWEDGQIQEITDGQNRRVRDAIYINDLIIVETADALTIFRDRGNSFEIAKSIQGDFSFGTVWWDAQILDQPKTDVLYGKHGTHIAKLDLKNLEVTDISALKTAAGAFVYAFLPDHFYLREEAPAEKTLTISSIQNDQIVRLREFPDFAFAQQGTRLDIQREGIILQSKNRTMVYAFPDLREIKY